MFGTLNHFFWGLYFEIKNKLLQKYTSITMPFFQSNSNNNQRNYSFATISGNNWTGVTVNGNNIVGNYKANGKFVVKIEWESEDPTVIYCDKDLKVEITGPCDQVDMVNGSLKITGNAGSAKTSNAEIHIGGDCVGNCSTSNATIKVNGSVGGKCSTSNGNIYKGK